MRRIALISLIFALACPGVKAAEKGQSFAQMVTQNLQPLKGDYNNPAAGYSITMPQHLSSWVATPSNPDRGVLVVLGDRRTIDIFGRPDTRQYHNTHELLVQLLMGEESDHTDFASGATLDGQPAEQATVASGDVRTRYLTQHRGTWMVGRQYTLVLTTDAAHLDEDGKVLAEVAKGFHVAPNAP